MKSLLTAKDFVFKTFSVLVIFAFLTQSIAPTTALAARADQAQDDQPGRGRRKLPVLPPEYYTPPVYERPTRTSPEEDTPKKVIPVRSITLART